MGPTGWLVVSTVWSAVTMARLDLDDVLRRELGERELELLARGERLGESPTFSGTWIYTKGTIRRKGREEVFHVFVSAKLAV
jgi:hypothetical protein